MAWDEEADDPAPRGLRIVHIAAVAAGNGLEFYDFLIYATFAVYIGRAFFPAHDPAASLLLSLATFGIGFVTRPLGGFVLGRLGDRIGRKPALLISFALTGVGVLGVAITPTYARIGLWAPALVILARLIQGFALGGEVGPSMAFLVEAARGPRRGLVGSMQGCSQGLAFLAASGMGLLLSLMLPKGALEDWGWRLAFAAGLLIVPFGLIMRRTLPETAPPRLAASAPREPVPWGLVVLGVMILANGTISTYVSSYMVTYALDTLHLPARAAFTVGIITGLCTLICAPISAALSDRYGRRPVMIPSALVLAVVILPSFAYLVAHPTAWALYATTIAVSVPAAFAGGPMLVALTESFPPRMRSLAVGAIYATTITVFGGTTQFVVAWLLHTTHQPMAPAYYRLAALLVALIALALLPESAPARRRSPKLAVVAGAA
jgi:MFS family permease